METQAVDLAPLGASTNSSVRTAMLAALLGLGLIFISGLLPIDIVHNAAHDARHSAAFPCH